MNVTNRPRVPAQRGTGWTISARFGTRSRLGRGLPPPALELPARRPEPPETFSPRPWDSPEAQKLFGLPGAGENRTEI
jgi:hypothetical protein